MNAVRQNSAMQEALRIAGVTEERIAAKVERGMNCMNGFGYTWLAAKLLDAFSAKKNLHGIVDPEELLNEADKETVHAPWSETANDGN